MKTKIIDWYKKEVPTDSQADELIRPNATFMDLLEKLYKGENVYDLFDDSLIRETCFSHLSDLTGRDYEYFYELWLEGGVKRREKLYKEMGISYGIE